MSPSIRVNVGSLFACDICNDCYHPPCVKIDEEYLKYIPVFSSPNALNMSLVTLSSYVFKKYIEKGDLNLANAQIKKKYCCNQYVVTGFLQIQRKLLWRGLREVSSAIHVKVSPKTPRKHLPDQS